MRICRALRRRRGAVLAPLLPRRQRRRRASAHCACRYIRCIATEPGMSFNRIQLRGALWALAFPSIPRHLLLT